MGTTSLAGGNRAHFDETHWSVVLQAGRKDESSTAALETLWRCYQIPLYTFVRHRGFNKADAEDLIQSFFLDLMEREALAQADRSKGRFRAFLLGSLKNFLANDWHRQRRLKRGGGCSFISLDELDIEKAYGHLSGEQLDAETLFDRAWALATLGRAMKELETEYAAEGRLDLFKALESVLSRDGRAVSYGTIAGQLGKTEEAIRMAASRMRRRFGELLRREVLKTVADPAEARDELHYLFSCL